jgi:hypothetical protein
MPSRGSRRRRGLRESFQRALTERKRPYANRRVDTLDANPSILIVCEGERTEPNYFKAFRVAKAVLDGMVVHGVGYNTVSLVREAIRLREEDGPFDEVWCVLDTDSFPVDNVRDAVRLATSEGIRVACSNEAFELWYFLHFHYLDTGISRYDYADRLDRLVPGGYRKNHPDMYDLLLHRQPFAAKNAARLMREHDPYDAATSKPSTTVHLLVEQLNEFVRT